MKHGMSGTRPYRVWQNMKKRCDNPNSPDYHRYGDRGICYCEEWSEFENFWRDMKDDYADNLTLDRIDVNGNYCKSNCRWTDHTAQNRNRRNNRHFEYQGKMLTIGEIAELAGVNSKSLSNRVYTYHMTIEEALSKPFLEQVTFNGVTKSLVEHAKEQGFTYHRVKKRLMRGWSVERALTEPLKGKSIVQ